MFRSAAILRANAAGRKRVCWVAGRRLWMCPSVTSGGCRRRLQASAHVVSRRRCCRDGSWRRVSMV